jgi:hypothetical protein
VLFKANIDIIAFREKFRNILTKEIGKAVISLWLIHLKIREA